MTYVSVDVDLGEFDDDDLVTEVRGRGYAVDDTTIDNDVAAQVQGIHDAYILGRQHDVERLLKDLFYSTLGRIT